MRLALEPHLLDDAGRAAHDTIVARRGKLAPLYQVLLARPVLALRVEELSAQLWDCGLPQATLEALFLQVAHRYGCEEQWRRHAPRALDAGVSQAGLDAIRKGLLPPDSQALQVACSVGKRLLHGRRIGDRLWGQAVQQYGEGGLAEICAFLAMAQMVAMAINLQDHGR